MPTIKIHYVGNRVYDMETFVNEAKKQGVNRAIPPSHLMSLELGEKIYLAFQRGKKSRYALIFGYFVYEGFSVSAPPEFWEDIMAEKKRFGIVKVEKANIPVKRGCGTYTISATFQIETEPRETIQEMWKLAKEKGYKVKFFGKGTFHKLPVPVRARIPFVRAIAEYEVPSLDATPENIVSSEVYYDVLTNYEQILKKPTPPKKKKKKKKGGGKK